MPREENERKSLSFDSFPWDSKLVFYLEAEENAWQRLGPLFDYLEETNIIAHTFGPAAYLLDVPGNNPTTEKVRAYQKHGRISIGYSLATTVLECSDVQIYDHDVKVGMEEVDEVDAESIPTGRRIKPKPPYARTNLRKELQRIRINDELIFHTAVMTCKGPDAGTSRIVISYKPSDPDRLKKYKFAKTTVANLACFMHHWWIHCGFNSSTRSRLMQSFYLEKAQLAEYSTWDSCNMRAVPHFTNRRDTYLTDFAYYDPGHGAHQQATMTPTALLDISDEVRTSLLNHLGTKNVTHADIGSNISGVSAHTGESDGLSASTINSTNSVNRALRTKDIALQLASSRAKQAEQEHTINLLRQQMMSLQQPTNNVDPHDQQGAPHLSGSGAPPPADPGGGEALQGP